MIASKIINYDLLFKRMDVKFEIRGNYLKWFRSYLTGSTQSVNLYSAGINFSRQNLTSVDLHVNSLEVK